MRLFPVVLLALFISSPAFSAKYQIDGMQLAATTTVGVPSSISYSTSTSTSGTYTIMWGTASNAATYSLEESFNGGAYSEVAITGNTNRTFTPAQPRANGNYIYRVYACDVVENCGGYRTGGTLTVSIPAPIVTASASPTPIVSGASSTVTWSSSNASSCTLNGSSVALNGSQTFSNITTTTTHTVICTGLGGSKTATATVAVVPIVSISANPSTVAVGGSSTLSWSSNNASSCTLDGTTVALTGSTTKANINNTTTYLLACSQGAGSGLSAPSEALARRK